jgi:predicted nucleotidyltransferase
MGMNTQPPPANSSLASALFSTTQLRVLGLLFGQPDRSFYANEIISLSGAGSGATQRELARLEAAGLVTTSRVGNQKHFQANPASPIFAELVGIMSKTVGVAMPLAEALQPFAKKIRAAFVYGSVAKKSDTAMSDIDLMVIADKLEYADLFEALTAAEARLGRPINPTVQSLVEWKRKLAAKNAFTMKVNAQPKRFVIGEEASLE